MNTVDFEKMTLFMRKFLQHKAADEKCVMCH